MSNNPDGNQKKTHRLLWAIIVLLAVIALHQSIRAERVSAAGSDVLVICSSCYFSPLPAQPHLVLMDRNNGDIWAYNSEAMQGKIPPTKLGRLTLGNPVSK